MNTQDERKAFESQECVKEVLPFTGFSVVNNHYYIKKNGLSQSGIEWLNGGWQMWQAATIRAEEKLEGCVVVPEGEFALLPKTITPVIDEILGMPCFKFIKAAQIYRQLGFDIPHKAEKEQSFFMFKFLHLALVHSDKCFDVFESETKAMVEAARGGNE